MWTLSWGGGREGGMNWETGIDMYTFVCLVKSCQTLFCSLMRCSPLLFSVHEISQSRILEWVAISFSRGSSWPRDGTCISCISRQILTTETPVKPYACIPSHFSHVWLFATLWTIAGQAPLFTRILQATTLEWVAMPSSRGSSWPRDRTHVSYVSSIGSWVLYH